ncbi:MAG: gamma-glutamylcyclotransferase family protein [Rhodospirillaceae bacterium]
MGALPTPAPEAPLFVFGSLLDGDILDIVLGPGAAAPVQRDLATLTGFRRQRVNGEPFPMLVASDEAVVHGALLKGLGAEAWARLAFYEGRSYALRVLPVEAGPERRRCSAHVFFATGRLQDSGIPWDLDVWRRTEKPLALLLATELMALYGQVEPDGPPDAVWDDIKIRCQACLSAVAERDHAHHSRTAASCSTD